MPTSAAKAGLACNVVTARLKPCHSLKKHFLAATEVAPFANEAFLARNQNESFSASWNSREGDPCPVMVPKLELVTELVLGSLKFGWFSTS